MSEYKTCTLCEDWYWFPASSCRCKPWTVWVADPFYGDEEDTEQTIHATNAEKAAEKFVKDWDSQTTGCPVAMRDESMSVYVRSLAGEVPTRYLVGGWVDLVYDAREEEEPAKKEKNED